MIGLQPIIDRLTAADFPRVAGALEYAAQTVVPPQLPAFFVLPEAEEAEENANASGIASQRVRTSFLLVVVLAGAAREARVRDDLQGWVDRAVAALVGWSHPDAGSPVEFGGGRLLSVDERAIAWGVRFRTSYHLRTRAR